MDLRGRLNRTLFPDAAVIKKNRNSQNNYNPGGSGSNPPAGGKTSDGGSIDLSAADESKAIVFAVAYSSAPAVEVGIAKPNGGFDLLATIDQSTLTTGGVTATFPPIPGASQSDVSRGPA